MNGGLVPSPGKLRESGGGPEPVGFAINEKGGVCWLGVDGSIARELPEKLCRLLSGSIAATGTLGDLFWSLLFTSGALLEAPSPPLPFARDNGGISVSSALGFVNVGVEDLRDTPGFGYSGGDLNVAKLFSSKDTASAIVSDLRLPSCPRPCVC